MNFATFAMWYCQACPAPCPTLSDCVCAVLRCLDAVSQIDASVWYGALMDERNHLHCRCHSRRKSFTCVFVTSLPSMSSPRSIMHTTDFSSQHTPLHLISSFNAPFESLYAALHDSNSRLHCRCTATREPWAVHHCTDGCGRASRRFLAGDVPVVACATACCGRREAGV